MNKWRIISIVTFVSLLTACGGQLAHKNDELNEQGYKKLSPYAYIREKANGSGFSTISEGKLGSFAIKLYLKRELVSTHNEIKKLNNQSKDKNLSNILEKREKSIQMLLRSIESAAYK